MHVDLIRDRDAIEKLRPNWDGVYDADPEANYFMSFGWLFANGAPAGRNGFVLAARPHADSGDYVAFLPLRMRTRERTSGGFHNEINCAGNYVSDYTGFICRPGFEEAALPALAARLRHMSWMRLNLEYFRATPARSELFLRGFPKSVFESVELSRLNPDGIDNSICPSTTLSDTWDKYLEEKVSSNTRQKIRRFLRQVEKSDEYRITHTTAETLKRDIDLLMELWTDKWGSRKGNRLQSIQNNNRRVLQHAFSTGTLFMPVLWHRERAICLLGIFVDDRKKTYNFYIGGRDEQFKGPPPGLVMHAYAIRHAIAQGMQKYDFLRGNEPYKYSFGCDELRLTSVVLTTRDRKNLGGKLDATSVPFVLERSIELHQANKLKQAEHGYRQILEVEPGHTKALYVHGQVLVKLGDYTAAIRQLRTLVGLVPGMVKAWYRLGRALHAQGSLVEAADAYVEVIRRQRNLPVVWCDLGRTLLRLEQIDLALAAYDTALGLKADHAGAIAGRAEVLRIRSEMTAQQVARRAARNAAAGARIAKIAGLSPVAEEPAAPAAVPAPPAPPPKPAARLAIERIAGADIPESAWRPKPSALQTILAASEPGKRSKPVIRTPLR
jgi:CelD/BcsL family acetyltransferase involved in cellulose biosynthesis/Flp pilus assembly protein TadD